MPASIRAVFEGGTVGQFEITRMQCVRGTGLPEVGRLGVREGSLQPSLDGGVVWSLRGSTGHVRYVERGEQAELAGVTPPLARAEATCGAMIPIRKSAVWWDLAQDERRAILAQRSRHIELGLRYLPAIARRLYHSRELGEEFDFVTWFEFAPEHEASFDELTAALRESEEWSYVDREVAIYWRRTLPASDARLRRPGRAAFEPI